jgi:putative peptidoglycan lipid II flippase
MKDIFVNLIFNIFSKVLLFFSYGFIVLKCGSSLMSDFYFYSLGFVGLLSGIFSVMVQTALPVLLIKLNSKDLKFQVKDFAGFILCLNFLIIILVCILIFYFKLELLISISNFPSYLINENPCAINLMIISCILVIINDFFRIYLQSLGLFKSVAIFNFIQCSLNILLLFYFLNKDVNLFSIILSLFISLIVQLFFYFFICFKRHLIPNFNLIYSDNLNEYFKISLPLLPAHIITLTFIFYLDYLALNLGNGHVTNLSLANKVSQIPLLALFMPVMEVLNIKLIQAFNNNKFLLQKIYQNYIKLQFLVFTFIIFFCVFFSKEIITILFQRGEFKYSSVVETANAFSIFLLLLISTSLIQLSNKILIIHEQTKLNSIVGSMGYLVMFFVAKKFINHFNYLGIPILKVVFDYLYFLPVLFFLFYKAKIQNFFTISLFKEITYILFSILTSFFFSYLIYSNILNMNFDKFYLLSFALKLSLISTFFLINLFLLSLIVYHLKKNKVLSFDFH